MPKPWVKMAAIFAAGAFSTITVQSFAQLNGELTIPTVTIRDAVTQKDILVCKWAMFMANGHYIMCTR